MTRTARCLFMALATLTLVAALGSADVYAQRERARPRVSPPRVVRTYVALPRPYYPWYYGPFGFGAAWAPYGWYPPLYYGYYAQYPYPHYRYYGYYDQASLRIQVEPKHAEVYIDGYYVGVVDSFDGLLQRLHVPPGEHVVEIFHEGYRPVRETMRFAPRENYQIRRAMEPLAPGDEAPVRPKPDAAARPAERDPYERRDDRRAEPARGVESGAVAIRVQPADATVLIDGEKWDGPEGPDRLVVHLSEGTHRIEIQKEGYRPFVTEVRIQRGETVPLNVSLRSGR